MKKKTFYFCLLLFFLTVSLSACTWPWKKKTAATQTAAIVTAVSENATTSKQLLSFSSDSDFSNFLSGKAAAPSAALVPAAASSSLVDFPVFSQTGAEDAAPDIFKVDNGYAYVLDKNQLKIISLASGDDKLVSSIDFDKRPQGLLVSGTQLAVYGADSQNSVFLKTYDLSDRQAPRLVRSLSFIGSYVDARLSGSYLYFLTAATVSDPAAPHPAVTENGQALGTDCSASASSGCVSTGTYYFDIAYGPYSLLEATAVDMSGNDKTLKRQEFLVDPDFSVYDSDSDTYLAYSEGVDETALLKAVKAELFSSKLPSSEQDKVKAIEAAPEYVLSTGEKADKLAALVDSYISSLTADEQLVAQANISNDLKAKATAVAASTYIYKFSLVSGAVAYRGQGQVAGTLLDHDSLAFVGQHLYVGTASISGDNSIYYGNIGVFGQDMAVTGSLLNIPMNYRPASARFFGGRAFFSSFLPGNPLYVIDTSDPAKMASAGAVKVPDYVSVLRAADSGAQKLIAFGQEKDGNGQASDLKLTLYDFSDLSQPKEADSFQIGDKESGSISLSDPQTFFYSPAEAVISLPVFMESNGKAVFAGALAFDSHNDKFSLLGKVDHNGAAAAASDSQDGHPYYDNTVKRSTVISGRLLTFSDRALKANSLDKFSQASGLILDGSSDQAAVSASGQAASGSASASSSAAATSSPAAATATDTATSSAPEEVTVTSPDADPYSGMDGAATSSGSTASTTAN